MCGLVFAASNEKLSDFIESAHARQNHRGPDAGGLYFEKVGSVNVGMAHQRLSIVDLSDLGEQPMRSSSGRYRVVFNGEIYNYLELAKVYRLNQLKSDTDTEVAIELIEKIGIDKACSEFNGMWALVVHDTLENKVYISRDRFGKKPLYFTVKNNGIYLASEMHTLLGLSGAEILPDPVVASRFLSQSLQNVDNRSWVVGIEAFPPASIGEIDLCNVGLGLQRVRRFWKASTLVDNLPKGESEYFSELREILDDSVRLRLNADVPVGVALSGGLDSSIISALAKKNNSLSSAETVLFSAVNPGSPEDESYYVDSMSDYLNIDVERFSLNPNEGGGLQELLERCISFADGPVSSFSNILFYKLMERASERGVTVVLTGQGADEVFCGYRKYPILEIKRRLKSGNVLSAINLAVGFLRNGTLLPEFNFNEAKRYLGRSNGSILGPVCAEALIKESLSGISSLSERQLVDIEHYSVPYLCHYEDRMSMAWSREIRSPFLDYRLVDLGLKMPESLKLSQGWTKYALRQAYKDDLPSEVVWRKDKKGFVNPQDDWLQGSLRSVVLDIMSSPHAYVYHHGLVDRSGYLSLFNSYCSGKPGIWFRDVFAPFSLELWLRSVNKIRDGLHNGKA